MSKKIKLKCISNVLKLIIYNIYLKCLIVLA